MSRLCVVNLNSITDLVYSLDATATGWSDGGWLFGRSVGKMSSAAGAKLHRRSRNNCPKATREEWLSRDRKNNVRDLLNWLDLSIVAMESGEFFLFFVC